MGMYLHTNLQNDFAFDIDLLICGQIKILVDDSPPEVGHVFDGPMGSPDRDFQSDTLIDFHWTGFIDHESGITKYHYGIGPECYTKSQLQFLGSNETLALGAYSLNETTHSFTSLQSSHLGRHHISVIAFNGAMEPSEAVCSSGVVVDATPPAIKHVSLAGARFTESIICDVSNDTLYALRKDGVLSLLTPTDTCLQHCTNDTELIDLDRFPRASLDNGSLDDALDDDESDAFCRRVIYYSDETPIYLPSDNIALMWSYTENESQMLDYYIGLSTTDDATTDPDLTGFVSSHNHTRYKCYHCGLGQGDEVYINMKAVNKANLEDHLIFGPVIVDLTSPMCTCQIDVAIEEDTVAFQWSKDCCLDNEDSRPLTDYLWAIGNLGFYHVLSCLPVTN